MQQYSNHLRFYTPHHFIFYPVGLAGAAICALQASANNSNSLLWVATGGLFLMLLWLSFMLRQHYALMNQNRTVRLEMRLRYYVLTQKRLETLEPRLSFGQLAALRFALVPMPLKSR